MEFPLIDQSILSQLQKFTIFLPIILINKHFSTSFYSIHESIKPYQLLPVVSLENINYKEINNTLAKVYEWLRIDSNTKNREILERMMMDFDFERLDRLFSKGISFGTGGLRAKLGPGFSQMNHIVIQQTAQGLSKLLKDSFSESDCSNFGVVIGFDGRYFSNEFANITAATLQANDIKVVLFTEVAVTPLISFSIIYRKFIAGVMITASHNPKDYNGFKVFWNNGAQIVSPRDKILTEHIRNSKELIDLEYYLNYHTYQVLNMPNQEPETCEIFNQYIKQMSSTLRKDISKKYKKISQKFPNFFSFHPKGI